MTFVFTFFIIIRWRAIIECALVDYFKLKKTKICSAVRVEHIAKMTILLFCRSPMLEDCSYVRSPNPPQSPHSPRPSLHNNRKGSQSDEESRASFKDLIKPVSVKLENCLLTNKGTKLVTPARAMSPTTSSHSKGAWIHLTSRELQGLGEVVYWLQGLPPTKRFVPKDLRDPDHLLSDVRVRYQSLYYASTIVQLYHVE